MPPSRVVRIGFAIVVGPDRWVSAATREHITGPIDDHSDYRPYYSSTAMKFESRCAAPHLQIQRRVLRNSRKNWQDIEHHA